MSTRFETVTTYFGLEKYQRMFASPTDGIELIIIGRPGIGKSRGFMAALGTPGQDFEYIRGNQTALEIYRKLFAVKDRCVLIDDVDDALTDPRKKTLLKEALDSEEVKTINWGSSTSRLLDEHGNPIPKSFTTRSRFCIIGNKLTERTEAHLSALLSRAFCIDFQPTIHELHQYVGTWFNDTQIFDYVTSILPLICEIDSRDYIHARKMKQHGEDWKQMLLNRCTQDSRLALALRVMNDPALITSQQQVAKFRELTGKSRRTYMYLQAVVRKRLGNSAIPEAVRLDES